MTLIIAEVNHQGVVMAADTAETRESFGPSGRQYRRTVFGTQKLFPIRRLNGGVSFWGAGEILIETPGSRSNVSTNVWLEDFIAVNTHFTKLEEFAYTLAQAVGVLVNPESSELGFHVAGIGKNHPGDGQPVFYRICNVDRHGGHHGKFEVEQTDVFSNLEEVPMLYSDGDDAVYRELTKRVGTGARLTTKPGHVIPREDITGRTEYHSAWVRFVSDLYQSAGLTRSIGGPVTALSIGLGADEFNFQLS